MRKPNKIESAIVAVVGVGVLSGGIYWWTNGGAKFVSRLTAPKSTPQSEALLEKIEEVRSRTTAGISYVDYSREAQDIQVLKDKFERDSKSKRIKYAGNLLGVASILVDAGDKTGSKWNPQDNWLQAEVAYLMMENCREKDKDCFELEALATGEALLKRLEMQWGKDGTPK